MAVTWRGGGHTIALQECITPDDRTRIIGGMEFRELGDETGRLQEPLAFLEHLVLHEVAELLQPATSETEKDRWAFQHLRGRFRSTP